MFQIGTYGILHGLVPANADALQLMLRTCNPGQDIALDEPPYAVLVHLDKLRHPEMVPSLQDGIAVIPLLTNSSDIARRVEINLGKDSNGKLLYNVVGAGYALTFASTVHGVQGSTLNRIVLDLNYNPSMKNGWLLSALYVAL